MLVIENNSTAMYFDFNEDGENISKRQFIVDRYIQIPKKERLTTTTKGGLNNITYTCSRLGKKRALKIFSG